MQDLIFLMHPSVSRKYPGDISWKAANLFLNRFTIDEDAAFELLGVAHEPKMNRLSWNKIKHLQNLHIIRPRRYQNTAKMDEFISYISNLNFENSQAKSAMITEIRLCRHFLITKEKMEEICKGQGLLKESVNDDIEALFADLQLGNKPKAESSTYFLPKLTHEEKKLVEKKDSNYLETFSSLNPNIDDDEMRSSESKSMFVRGWCARKTYILQNPMFQDQDVSSGPSDQISVGINSLESKLDYLCYDDIEERSQYQRSFLEAINKFT